MSDCEFEYKGNRYFYEVDGYKVFGLVDKDGNDVSDEEIYNAACDDWINCKAGEADLLRDDIRENGPYPNNPEFKVRFP